MNTTTPKQGSSREEVMLWPEKAGAGLVEVSAQVDFPHLDHQVLKLWEHKRVFYRTIEEREGSPDYVAYDGPPGTNGAPHIGHILQSALKDLWPRFWTMRGYRVLRKAGWDTHGLPVELTAEKELGLKSKRDITQYGVEKYIQYCRSTVYRYKEAWTYAIKRIGRFLDTEHAYATLTRDYIQTGWWVLKQAWDKGLLYKDYRILPYCSRCGTTLSQHETAQGYRDIEDISLYVKFPLRQRPRTYLVAWTTTPWTLLSNVALAVNPELHYLTLEQPDGERLIVAEPAWDAVKAWAGKAEVRERRKGKELEGWEYQPLWDFLEMGERAHRVVADDYVTATEGSGIVHLALYGEDDYRLIRKFGFPMIQNVDADGFCTPNTQQFAGRWFREPGLDRQITEDLKARGLLLGEETITHSYPHCYRCDTPLMYFARTGWFLRTTAFKEEMIRANEAINWFPDHIKYGRFGNWLEGNLDWNISRERYWGTPLPIWTCRGCGEQICVESLGDLERRYGQPLGEDFDPHKPHIDQITFPCPKCRGEMVREPEVLDSWFDAGIMPWGQWGYPATPGSESIFTRQYPADFICEAIDQTRGWFYTLLACSVMLTGISSYRNVICTELITDAQGRKMSKSRGNVVDPVEICEKYGADAVRWNFYSVNPWTARRFQEEEIRECLRRTLIPYWNAYVFFTTYARVDHWQPPSHPPTVTHPLDRWVLSRLEWLKGEVTTSLEHYDVTAAALSIDRFIDELTNWYIRRSRRRFWKSEDDSDKRAAYFTLYTTLTQLNRLLAPFIPFTSEAIYQNLERGFNPSAPDSVHLSFWPELSPHRRQVDLEEEMSRVRQIVTLGRSLRADSGVKVRQPLLQMWIAGVSQDIIAQYSDIIQEELNLKSVSWCANKGELLTLKAKGDWKALGPRLGPRAKEVIAQINALPSEVVERWRRGEEVEVEGAKISPQEVIIEEVPKPGLVSREERDLLVALDLTLTEELKREGLARELVHHIQNLRKDLQLEIVQRIELSYYAGGIWKEVLEEWGTYIASEILALSLHPVERVDDLQALPIGPEPIYVRIKPVEKS